MALSDRDRQLVQQFRDHVEQQLAQDQRLGHVTRLDREDDSTLCSRFEVAAGLWVELGLRPHIPQLRAAIVTDDRWLSEDLESAIEDCGDTMSEFIEAGFDEVGLDWSDPVVEHYRDQGKWYYFSTAFELDSLAQLTDTAVREKITLMVVGYYEAFRPAIEKAAAER